MSKFTTRAAVHAPDFEAVVLELAASDIRRMVERHGGRFFDQPGCPACCSRRHDHRYTVHDIHYQGCQDCGAVYVSPCPPEDVVRQFYQEAESLRFWREHMPSSVARSRQEHLYAGRAHFLDEQLRRFHPEARTLLEVGAGQGELAEKILALTPIEAVILVEPQPLGAPAPGVRTANCRFEEYSGDGPVDVVLAFEVLEHISDPARFVARVRSLLAPGGLFVLSTPNVAGFELATLGALSSTILFDHVCLHTPRSLGVLLRRTGLEVLDLQTPGEFDVQSVRAHYERGALDLSDNIALQFLLGERDWDERFQGFLRRTRQSSHLKCVARRCA